MQYLDYDVIICPNHVKETLIKEYPFTNIKYISINEFKNKYLFEYKSDTLYYLVNKYKILPENAKIIMDNLYYLKDKTEKLNNLIKIKQDLIDNNYIKVNNNFKTYIKDKKNINN